MNIKDILSALGDEALLQVPDLPFPKVASGKVREIYDFGEELLIVATDRLSAFDVVLPDGVPGKGVLLTQLSLHWFEQTRDIVQNHIVPDHTSQISERLAGFPELCARSMVVRKLKPLTVEAVVRGYLAGSGWKCYQQTGNLWGQDLPEGLIESDRLPDVLFTPTTKADSGHDEPLTLDQCREMLGDEVFEQVKDISFKLFQLGSEKAAGAGLILADTKFEFGLDDEGGLFLIDELLTPDSSRYWPLDEYTPGRGQTAFDKQYVRDYLETLDWDKTPPGPTLPPEVIRNSLARYTIAVERLIS